MARLLSTEPSIEHQTISRDELRARLRDRSLIILDVLPKEAYAEAHIPGALSLPVAEIETKARQLISNLTQETRFTAADRPDPSASRRSAC
jgi:rhodanese-related sulfurtransferase